VVLFLFLDVVCGLCNNNYYMITARPARRGQQIEIVHRHFPLDSSCNEIVPESVHPDACGAAEAAECAGLQGKRDEMIDILFKNQTQLFPENLPRLAGKIGLDPAALKRCLDEHQTLPTVMADARAGARLDIKSTPTLFLGGRRITGVLDEVRKYEMAVLIAAGDGAGRAVASRP
jgi:predicted DsbA family dithiol-disulfide isomerase